MAKGNKTRRYELYRTIRDLTMCEHWHVVARIGDKVIEPRMGKAPWHRDFCADCFPFSHGGKLYLFYETVNPAYKGLLGCFVLEGEQWRQLGPVLEQPWHMSYPQVFEENGHLYMIPEQSNHGKGDVSLYEATDFPKGWVKVATLINRPFADSTLLRKDGHCYMACYTTSPNDSAELWHAPSLLGPWERHSQWFNVNQSRRLMRCGGAFLEEDGKIYRIAQDLNGGYGKRLFKVPVLKISPTEYKEGPAELMLGYETYPKGESKHTFNRIVHNGQRVEVYDTKSYVFKPLKDMARDIVGRLRGTIRNRLGR